MVASNTEARLLLASRPAPRSSSARRPPSRALDLDTLLTRPRAPAPPRVRARKRSPHRGAHRPVRARGHATPSHLPRACLSSLTRAPEPLLLAPYARATRLPVRTRTRARTRRSAHQAACRAGRLHARPPSLTRAPRAEPLAAQAIAAHTRSLLRPAPFARTRPRIAPALAATALPGRCSLSPTPCTRPARRVLSPCARAARQLAPPPPSCARLGDAEPHCSRAEPNAELHAEQPGPFICSLVRLPEPSRRAARPLHLLTGAPARAIPSPCAASPLAPLRDDQTRPHAIEGELQARRPTSHRCPLPSTAFQRL
ncbi:hypothetical protein PVAP13_7KG027658 [Panicum virgatum]|uniref:Uncharacterized protein n=1 Tax=Panicum virgatum TaxID=38727 RepID=A0A8T0QDN8_PANVG|nr:hypothetical protein PVAP13_7KG027658 [Panicum virgatum]